jgi:hypothetical protein
MLLLQELWWRLHQQQWWPLQRAWLLLFEHVAAAAVAGPCCLALLLQKLW